MSTMGPAVDAIRAAGGRRIKGPSAFTGDARRALNLTWTLAFLEFRLRFFGSVLGYVWQLGRPLLMFGVLYVVFVEIVELGAGIPYYASALLTSIMLYQFFGEATGGAVTAVLARENLVRKIHFPRIVIPMAVVVTALLTLAANSLAIAVFVVAQGVPVRASWLVAIPVIGFLIVFAVGLAMLLSALFVRYRDVQPIWEVALQALFYATPILYPIGEVPDSVEPIIMASPLAAVIQQIRHSVFDPSQPSAADALGGPVYLLVPLAIGIGTFVVGLWVFNRTAPAVAEEL
jgi:ABC-2 type transport system permease protein